MHPPRSHRPHHDPTSVAARKLQSKQKQAHRIKLRKQLEKARRKLELATGVSTEVGAEAGAEAEVEAVSRPELETEKVDNLSTREREGRTRRDVSASSTRLTPPGSSSPMVATSGPARMMSRPNPLRRALDRREERQEEMRLAAEQRNQELKAREEARASKIRERERLRKKLSASTRTGQPRLFKHIDVLLEKIQKSGN